MRRAGLALPSAPIVTFLDRLQASFAQLGALLPALLGALVIVFAGYLLARLVQKGTERMLRRVQLNQLLERGGVMQAVERSGSTLNPTRIVSNLLFWFIMFAVLLLAANALGLESLALVFTDLVNYIPSVIAAVVIVIVGIVLGEFVGGLIHASAGSLHGGPTLARVGRGMVVVISVFMALLQLGVATDIVTTAFAILFGAVAFALSIAFGLGSREVAGEITRAWYDRYKAEKAAIEREVAEQEAAEQAAEEAEARAAAQASAERAARQRDRERAHKEKGRRKGDPTPGGTLALATETPLGTPTVRPPSMETPLSSPPVPPPASPTATPPATTPESGPGSPADRRP